jgi:hypothetical protein
MKITGILGTSKQKKALISGVIGLALILLGVKLAIDLYFSAHVALDLNGKPALLYVTDDHPCECAKRMIAEADFQIKNWSEPQRLEVQLIRVSLGDRLDLEEKYDVFRAPTLILLDAQGQVVYRQDYPFIGGKPIDLPEFEAKMVSLNILTLGNPPQ